MEKPKINRKIFLLGAGAAMSWGGPSTPKVTDLILGRIDDIAQHTDIRFTNLIYNFLNNKYSQDPNYIEGPINFEDIINVTEELILFYSKEVEPGRKHILPHFFDLKSDFKKDLEALFTNDKSVYENLLDSLNKTISSITNLVHQYSRHYSREDSKITPCGMHFIGSDKKDRIFLIQLFNSWALKVGLNHSYIRAYTLNYDRLYKVLFENFFEEIKCELESEIFEGFEGLFPSVKDILFKRDQHCHFNLHGSAYWHLTNRLEFFGLQDFIFTLNNSPYWQNLGGVEAVLAEIEVGRPFVLSNIIAGYRKSQRSFGTPFKQMHASFEMDCLQADEIYIIGYSFSDAHINAGIASALVKNRNLKINIVDPSFNQESFKKLITKIFPSLFYPEELVNVGYQDKKIPYQYHNLIIYPLKFEDYLKFQNNIK